jgi:DNA polymerase
MFREAGKTSISKYTSFQQRTCKDGRLRDNLVFHGARTGRWAGKGTQLQNFPRGQVKDIDRVCDEITHESTDFLELVHGSIPKLLSHALRGALVASPGMILNVADYAAIEARTEFWLVDDLVTLQAFKDGVDIYKQMAQLIYGVGDINDITGDQRFVGKQAILGLGYQMWAPKFKDTCVTAGKKFGISVNLSDEFSKKIVLSYRIRYSLITAFWKSLENAAISAIRYRGEFFCAGKIQFSCGEKFLRMRLPGGRYISYLYPRVDLVDTMYGGERQQISYMGMTSQSHQWTRLETFGGKIAENATQAVARDFMAHGLKKMRKTGRYFLLFSSHDEVISESYAEDTNIREYEDLMCSVPTWGYGMPLKAEGWTGHRYKK